MTELFTDPANTSSSPLPLQPEQIDITPADIEEANKDTIQSAIYGDIDRLEQSIRNTTSPLEQRTLRSHLIEARSAERAADDWNEDDTFRVFVEKSASAENDGPEWASAADAWLSRSSHLIGDVMRTKAEAEIDERAGVKAEAAEQFLTPTQMQAAKAALAGTMVSSESSRSTKSVEPEHGAETNHKDMLVEKADKMLEDILTPTEQNALSEASQAANRQVLDEYRRGIADGPATQEVRRLREIGDNQGFQATNPNDIPKMYELLGITDAASIENAQRQAAALRDAQTRTPVGMVTFYQIGFFRDPQTRAIEPSMGALFNVADDRYRDKM